MVMKINKHNPVLKAAGSLLGKAGRQHAGTRGRVCRAWGQLQALRKTRLHSLRGRGTWGEVSVSPVPLRAAAEVADGPASLLALQSGVTGLIRLY